MKRVILSLALGGLFAGCAWRTQIQHGTVSTSRMDVDKCYEVDRSHKIKGADRAHGVWFIPLGFPDADEAVTKALAEANKNSKRKIVGIADTDLKFRFLWLYLYSQRFYTVEGYPIYEKKP